MVMYRVIASLLLLLLLAAVSGCDERASAWDRALDIDGPMVADAHLAWLDRTTARLVLVDTADRASARSINLTPRPRGMAVAGRRVLVSAGTGSDPVLEIVDIDGADGEAVSSLDLEGEPFDLVWVAPEGGHAVLTHSMAHSTDGSAAAGLAARNLNRIGIVDLSGSTPAVRGLLLQTESIAPKEVVFSPDGRLAAVVLDSAIAIVELESPDRHVRVPLRLPGGQRLSPREVVFSPETEYLYVRASGTADLLVLEILEGSAISATVNFLFVPEATSLEAMSVLQCEGMEKHVAALFKRANDSVVALLHATGDDSLGSRVVLSRRASRLTDLGSGILLVHGVSSGSRFGRWVAGWEPATGRVAEREVQGDYVSEPLVAGGQAFFRHESVTVPDLGTMPAVTAVGVDPSGAWLQVKPSSVMLLGAPTADDVDGDGTYLVAVSIERLDSGAAHDLRHQRATGRTGALVAITEGTLAMDGLVLDDEIEALGVAGDHVFAIHDGVLGDVTLIPRDDLVREAAVRYDGLLLAGLLDVRESR